MKVSSKKPVKNSWSRGTLDQDIKSHLIYIPYFKLRTFTFLVFVSVCLLYPPPTSNHARRRSRKNSLFEAYPPSLTALSTSFLSSGGNEMFITLRIVIHSITMCYRMQACCYLDWYRPISSMKPSARTEDAALLTPTPYSSLPFRYHKEQPVFEILCYKFSPKLP